MVINRKDPQGINLTQDGHPNFGFRYGEISTTWFYQVCVRMGFLSLSFMIFMVIHWLVGMPTYKVTSGTSRGHHFMWWEFPIIHLKRWPISVALASFFNVYMEFGVYPATLFRRSEKSEADPKYMGFPHLFLSFPIESHETSMVFPRHLAVAGWPGNGHFSEKWCGKG